MSYYRLYYLNQHGHIRHAVDWECADDPSALSIVGKHVDGRAMELWSGERRVAAFPAREGLEAAVWPGGPHGPRH